MSGFADPWEHVRLLSDVERNAAILGLLRRRSAGQVVVEIGCGTGLWSCVAARLGAERVVAIEETAQALVARALVKANGLEHVVEVHHASFADVSPEPAGLVFSELLNAEPFAEGILAVSEQARAWVGASGHLAPRRLEVWCALVEEGASADEVAIARRQVDQLGAAFDLDVGAVHEVIAEPGPYVYLDDTVRRVSTPGLIFATDLREPTEPSPCEIVVDVPEDAVAGGVALWFRAELDEGLVLHNTPGASGHWGLQILGWPQAVAISRGRFALWAEPDDTGFEVSQGASP